MPAQFDGRGKRVRGKKNPPPPDQDQQALPETATAVADPPAATTNGDAPAGDRVPTPPVEEKVPKPIQLTSQRDVALMAIAVKDRAATLTKLARTTQEEGYPQEAQREKNDAGTLLNIILPRITASQGELPIPPEQELPSAIGAALDVAMEGVENKLRRKVLDLLAPRVVEFAVELANVSFAAGYSARKNDAASLALSAVHKLRAAKANSA